MNISKTIRQKIAAPLLELNKNYRQIRQGATNLNKHGLAYYNFWDIGSIQTSWFYRFLQRPALRKYTSRKKIGLFSVFGSRKIINLNNADKKIFFSGENLQLRPKYADYGGEAIDLALGFDHYVTHPEYLRFPLWIIDIFSPEYQLNDIEKCILRMEAASRNFSRRSVGCSLIARHDNNGLRGRLSGSIAKFMKVTFPGPYQNNTDGLILPDTAAKHKFLLNCQVNLCPENSDAPGYCTEKLFHAIEAGCVPVYWGTGNRPEPDILNQEAILFYDPENHESSISSIAEIIQNEHKLKSLASMSRFNEGAGKLVFKYFTQLEEKILSLN